MGATVADMNEDRQGPGRRGGEGFWWGVEAPSQEPAFLLQAQHSRNGAKSTGNWEEGGREGGTDQAAAQNTVKTEPIDTTLYA